MEARSEKQEKLGGKQGSKKMEVIIRKWEKGGKKGKARRGSIKKGLKNRRQKK